MLIYRKFDDPVVAYPGPANSLKLTRFAQAKTEPLIKPFDTDTVNEIFAVEPPRPAIILFLQVQDDFYLKPFREAAAFFEEKFLFTVCYPDVIMCYRMADLTGIHLSPMVPATVRIVLDHGDSMLRFQPSKRLAEMSSDDIVLFILEFMDGFLEPLGEG